MQNATLEFDPVNLVEQLLKRDRRILLFGQSGVGKTTLATAMAEQLFTDNRSVWYISADPGSPAFGIPGAICLGNWKKMGWSLSGAEALCSLDAARFRLPLFSAVRLLASKISEGCLLLDAPGVIRGVAGAELLTSLVQAADIDLILVIHSPDRLPPLTHELQSMGIEVTCMFAPADAAQPSKKKRAKIRTRLWDLHLQTTAVHRLSIDHTQMVGTPPRKAPEAWLGKQVAFLDKGKTVAMGEVIKADYETLWIRLPTNHSPTNTLLVRDACRDANGLLNTSKPFANNLVQYMPPPDLLPHDATTTICGVRPIVHVGKATATLMNGIFGDPLLHLRLRNKRRSILFDLGDGTRLPARIAHQVSDVFITHAHVDHISGFLWLLRSRIGESSVCRLYGPPGLATHIASLIAGIHWDRIGMHGPLFDVAELDGKILKRYRIQAGQPGCVNISEVEMQNGLLYAEPEFCVRAITLDHGTPVLAFAYESAQQINVRKDRLLEKRLQSGPWLKNLKKNILAGEYPVKITLPNGNLETVAKLAEAFIQIKYGEKMVYATDFADTPENRHKIHALAKDAHTLFCEATFLQQDSKQAMRTGHLTTLACGEIANTARVQHLIPFHFSRRYEDQSWKVYQEIGAVCPQLVRPKTFSDDTE